MPGPRTLFIPYGDAVTGDGGRTWTPKWREWVRLVSDLLQRISYTGTAYGIVVTDDRGVAQAVVGEMDDVAFDAATFTSDTGTWVVEAADAAVAFERLGRMLTLSIELATTTVTGTPAELRMTLPQGFTAARRMGTVIYLEDDGTPVPGLATVDADSDTLTITRLDGMAFAAAADTTAVRATVTCEINPIGA